MMSSAVLTMLNNANDFVYTYLLVIALCGAGIYFTFLTKGIQFDLKSMLKYLVRDEDTSSTDKSNISSFQAFAVSTASRVGTGNLAGVTIAIVVGGPGALFWMWVTALLGGAISFAESTLAQVYKIEDTDRDHRSSLYKGGPAFYIAQGLSQKWLSKFFAVALIFVFGFAFNAVQSNTIAQSFSHAYALDPMMIAIVLSIVTGIFLFKGLPTIAKASAFLVPIMSLLYIALSSVVIFLNIEKLPEIFTLIFTSAFGIKEMGVGVFMGTLITGVKRGLFSNEAGMGSAPNVAATATTSHPVKQGLIQAFGVFFDTIVVCSVTGFLILFSGVDYAGSELKGIALTQEALTNYFGASGAIFLSVCILLLAFSSILGNYFYALNSVALISNKKSTALLFKLLVIFNVFLGAIASLDIVWATADLLMFFMAIVNLYAIVRLSKVLKIVLNDYNMQKAKNINPVFKKDKYTEKYPEIFSHIDQWS
ncbi:MAG: alanine/glycine:cation symporter family protein [Brevinema sp.]